MAQKITRPHLISCEGIDAYYFLIWFLQDIYGENQNIFQVDDFKGITELKNYLKTLHLRSGFNSVKSLSVIRDAETDAKAASQSVCDALNDGGFAVPKNICEIATPENGQHPVKTAYALFPAFNSLEVNGTLEDLCLNTLTRPETDTILKIADESVSSVIEQNGELKRKHKNRLHTYLSLTDKFVGMKVGESARIKAFNFDAVNYEPLKLLLENILLN